MTIDLGGSIERNKIICEDYKDHIVCPLCTFTDCINFIVMNYPESGDSRAMFDCRRCEETFFVKGELYKGKFVPA